MIGAAVAAGEEEVEDELVAAVDAAADDEAEVLPIAVCENRERNGAALWASGEDEDEDDELLAVSGLRSWSLLVRGVTDELEAAADEEAETDDAEARRSNDDLRPEKVPARGAGST